MPKRSRATADIGQKGVMIHSLFVASKILQAVQNEEGITYRQVSRRVTSLTTYRTTGLYLAQLVEMGFLERKDEITTEDSQTRGMKQKFITHYNITDRGRVFLAFLKESLPDSSS